MPARRRLGQPVATSGQSSRGGVHCRIRGVARSVEVAGRGGTSFAPVIKFLDEHREYDGAIIFTDGYAPVPPPPKNRRTRVLWLFKSEETYRRQHGALRAIGRAAFLKEAHDGATPTRPKSRRGGAA